VSETTDWADEMTLKPWEMPHRVETAPEHTSGYAQGMHDCMNGQQHVTHEAPGPDYAGLYADVYGSELTRLMDWGENHRPSRMWHQTLKDSRASAHDEATRAVRNLKETLETDVMPSCVHRYNWSHAKLGYECACGSFIPDQESARP
jgi:hypothetical protein